MGLRRSAGGTKGARRSSVPPPGRGGTAEPRTDPLCPGGGLQTPIEVGRAAGGGDAGKLRSRCGNSEGCAATCGDRESVGTAL